jgi:DNA modification methylase
MGIDTNFNLLDGYEKLQRDLVHKNNISIMFRDAAKVDYSTLFYDLVLTSPPYYNIELYNGTAKKSKEEWNEWYRLVFRKTWDGLAINGHYCLNINDEIYNSICVQLFGEPTDTIPLKMSGRNKYKENIYVWKKTA